MRPPYPSITPAIVRNLTLQHLADAGGWKATRRVSVDQLLRVVVLAAAQASSLFDIVRRLFDFSHHAAYRAIHANGSSLDAVADTLNRTLHGVFRLSRIDRRKGWVVAIDTHLVPYYGRRTTHVVGGPRKAGTKYFHGYATATIVENGWRYTLAIEPYTPADRPHQLARRLLDRITGSGLKIRGITADSGFESGDTLLLLQERGLAYAVPLRRKGNATNARNRLFDLPRDRVHTASWKTDVGRRPVSTAVYVWRRRGRSRGVMVMAFAGWTAATARKAATRNAGRESCRSYRARFGIETSYRQKNQARGFTTSRSAGYRLLLEGVAHLIRQVWVLLTEQVTGTGEPGWVPQLPLRTLIRWLDAALRVGLLESGEVPLPQTTSSEGGIS
jgi:hypothetical protein